MTALSVLETIVSLAVQVSLLIALTAWTTRKRVVTAECDSCWASFYVCLLLLTAAAFFLPHVRLVTWADFEPSESHPIAEAVCMAAGRICGWVWLTGALAMVAVNVGGLLRATALVRRARIDENLREMLNGTIAEFVPPTTPIEIRVSPDDVSPFCWQIHTPVIVLPEIVRSFPTAEQKAIVKHELAHLRLQHPLHLFLQRLVEAVYWFHPLVWWASRQAADAREFRCDRESVGSRLEVTEYLRSLLRLMESQMNPPEHLSAGIGFMGDASLLSRRAKALAECPSTSPGPRLTWRSVLPLLAAGALCSAIWLPVNPSASRRSDWSPWPTWSAKVLDATGVAVRDYEIDGHRLNPREYRK